MNEIKSNIIKDKSNNENGSIIMQSNMTLNVNLPYNAFITTNFNSLILKNRFCFIGKSDKIFLDSDSKIKLNYFDFYINVARTGSGLICTGGFPTVVFSDKHRADSENKSLGLFNYSATYNRNFNNVNWLCKKISDNMIGKIITSLSNQANFALTLGYDGILIDGDLYSLIEGDRKTVKSAILYYLFSANHTKQWLYSLFYKYDSLSDSEKKYMLDGVESILSLDYNTISGDGISKSNCSLNSYLKVFSGGQFKFDITFLPP